MVTLRVTYFQRNQSGNLGEVIFLTNSGKMANEMLDGFSLVLVLVYAGQGILKFLDTGIQSPRFYRWL